MVITSLIALLGTHMSNTCNTQPTKRPPAHPQDPEANSSPPHHPKRRQATFWISQALLRTAPHHVKLARARQHKRARHRRLNPTHSTRRPHVTRQAPNYDRPTQGPNPAPLATLNSKQTARKSSSQANKREPPPRETSRRSLPPNHPAAARRRPIQTQSTDQPTNTTKLHPQVGSPRPEDHHTNPHQGSTKRSQTKTH
jgi:hypothetical protein